MKTKSSGKAKVIPRDKPPKGGIELLIHEINLHLKENTSIRGFSKERLHELVNNRFVSVHSYEWRFLVLWKRMYLHEFESLYHIEILSE